MPGVIVYSALASLAEFRMWLTELFANYSSQLKRKHITEINPGGQSRLLFYFAFEGVVALRTFSLREGSLMIFWLLGYK